MSKSIAIGLVIGAALAPSISNAFKTLDARAQGLRKSLSQAKFGAGAAGDLLKYQQKLQELRGVQQRVGHGSVQVNRELAKTQRLFREAAQTAGKYGISIKNAAAMQRNFSVAARQSEAALARTVKYQANKDLRGELGGQVMGTVGLAMAASLPIKQVIEFESVMADVKKVVNFDTPEQFQKMGADILQLSGRIPMAASGLADIMAAAAQSGIARDELLDFTTTAAKMGVAFDLTGAEAGKMMADWRSALGLNQGKVVALADAVNHLSNNMNAQAPALGEVVQRVGAVGMAAGLSETQVAALGAAFLSTGAGPEIASTALKNFTGSLTKAGAMSKEQTKAFRSLGFDPNQLAKGMQKDAKGTIMKVLEALKNAPEWKRNSLTSILFGEESKGAIAPLLANLDNLRGAFDLVADQSKYSGSMQAEFDARSKTTANSLQLLANQGTRLGVTLGATVLPALNSIVSQILPVVEAVGTWAAANPELTKGLVSVAVGLAAAKVGLLGLRYGMSVFSDLGTAAKGLFGFLRPSVLAANASMLRFNATALVTAARTKALGAGGAIQSFGSSLLSLARGAIPAVITGIRAMGLAVVSNPIGLIAAALVGAAVLVYRYWGPIKSFFKGVWQGLSVGLKPVMDVVGPFFEWLGGKLAWVGDLFTPIWEAAKSVGAAFADLFSGANTDPSAPAQAFGYKAGRAVVEAVKFCFLNMTPVGWVIQAWEPVMTFFSGLGSQVMSLLSSIDLSAAGRAMLDTMVSGLKAGTQAVVGAVKNVFSAVSDLIPHSDAKTGPLSTLTASGRAIPETIGAGIRQAGPAPLAKPLGEAMAGAGKVLGAGIPGAISMDTTGPAQAAVAAKAQELAGDPRWQSPAAQAILRKHMAAGAKAAPLVTASGGSRTPAQAAVAATAQERLNDPRWQSPAAQALLRRHGAVAPTATAAPLAAPKASAAAPGSGAGAGARAMAELANPAPAKAAPAAGPAGAGSGMSVTINITVNGGDEQGVKKAVEEAMSRGIAELERRMAGVAHQRRRVAYA